MRDEDLTGQKFGRLTAHTRIKVPGKRLRWGCACECGNQTEVPPSNLKSGNTKSCGCLATETNPVKTTHGLSRLPGGRKNPTFYVWQHLKDRCLNPNNEAYPNYGGRGIRVHPDWVSSFEAFYAYVGPRPGPDWSIDRFPNNDGNYEPGNVRWATKKEQSRNRRTAVLLTFNAKTQCISAWAEELGSTRLRIWQRLRMGWSVERALTEPPQR